MSLKSPVWFGVGFLALALLSGSTYAVLQSQALQGIDRTPTPTIAQALNCITIATDPKPPLNVRSSPVVAPDNVIGKLTNGTHLTIVDENEGWLRVSHPLDGWVYKELTVTSCTPNAQNALAQQPSGLKLTSDREQQILNQATEQYHAGNLARAIALAKSIPSNSPAYPQAQAAVPIWQRNWQLAETKFSSAQKALQAGRWQDVINQVSDFPENRFWRGKLTPLIQEAIKQRSAQANRGG